MKYNFPPIPTNKKTIDISTIDVGQVYCNSDGEKLYVIGCFISMCAGTYTGSVDFKNEKNKNFKVNHTELTKLKLVRVS